MGDLWSPDFFVFQTCDIRTNHVGANTVRPSCRLYNLWYSYVASAFCNLHGLSATKSLSLFADFTLFNGIEKAVQRFFLRHRFIIICTFVCF